MSDRLLPARDNRACHRNPHWIPRDYLRTDFWRAFIFLALARRILGRDTSFSQEYLDERSVALEFQREILSR